MNFYHVMILQDTQWETLFFPLTKNQLKQRMKFWCEARPETTLRIIFDGVTEFEGKAREYEET